jgi:outer membrane protein assembly factor BamB
MNDPDATIDQPAPSGPRGPEESPPSGSAAELAGLLDRYMADLQAGGAPDRDQLVAAHPGLAVQLEACLAGIDFVHRATGPPAEEPASLGEFRILREVGRGGMGVVYEAEQTSLRRHVALKVLRFGVVADEEAMRRFRREAETVARLHHTNIVPIFAVGCEHGVHYYAMQFIEGRSLAEVLEESQRTGKPLASEDAARWGLQAAEALAHAHQRGVIHRDIKPSNLLLDTEGVVWLTDFGLAKRADEATLTVSGTLMGTPRYMSPEQAESLQRPVDHRTDLYSLGASLYELATGRPLFEAATPHGVILRILTEDPARPRQIRPELPRDLETIILTCLAKDPAQRYPSARALAEDLRAVLDGRPIKARRAAIIERVVRYVRKRRRMLGGGALVVAATVLLMLGAWAGWRSYGEWRLGRVVLTTDGPPLRAQVLAESADEPIGEPFDVGTRTLLPLPAGDYRLRVTGTGLLGQTYRFAVNRGETLAHRIALGEGRLMGTETVPYSSASAAMALTPGKSEFVEWNGQTLIRRDGATGKSIWDAARPDKPWDPKHDPVAWMRRLGYFGYVEQPGKLVQPAPDLDGDGIGDIVWAFRGTPSFLALSGQDGSLLWTYTAEPEGLGGPDPLGPAEPRSAEELPRLGRLIGAPAAVGVDGDGPPDLVAAFYVNDDRSWPMSRYHPAMRSASPWALAAFPGRRAIVAVSGRSGRGLWTYPLDVRSSTLQPPLFDVGAILVPARNRSIVAVVEGSRWIGLDPATGRPAGAPIDLGFDPVRPVQHVDLDGDGAPEILALGPGASDEFRTLATFSSATGRRLWAETVRGPYRLREVSLPPEWPLASDLDGDGRAEVVVPDFGPFPTGGSYRGLRLLDGATGRTRWTRPSAPYTRADDHLLHLVAAPDLDGDGTRDVVAVSTFDGRRPHLLSQGRPPEPKRIFLDAVSGRDGHPFWWWHADLEEVSSPLIWPPRWWGRGPDGWPLALIALGGNDAPPTRMNSRHHPEPPVVHLLAAATGREVHTLAGLSWPKVADLDGDGLDDLWGSVDGKLSAVRGEPSEAWRVLGRFQPAGDLDGDGIADVLILDPKAQLLVGGTLEGARRSTAVARSGQDGRVLWRTVLDAWEPWSSPGQGSSSSFTHSTSGPGSSSTLSTFPLPDGDLDGDGIPEVVVRSDSSWTRSGGPAASLPVQVLSGRSGQRLWSAGPLPLGFEAYGHSLIRTIDVRVCDPLGRPDLLVVHASPFPKSGSVPFGTSYWQGRVARLSGLDGRVVWDTPLVEHKAGLGIPDGNLLRDYGDLDGDGGLDVVLLVEMTAKLGQESYELRAVSLRDGRPLWSRPVRSRGPFRPPLAVGDLDGDGRAEVVVLDRLAGGETDRLELTALEGRDGSVRWAWRGGPDLGYEVPSEVLLRLVDFDGGGRREVCLNVPLASGLRRVVALDARGRERAHRELAPSWWMTFESADVDGDGREELLFQYDGRLRAGRAGLTDLWSWPTYRMIHQLIPARGGRAGTIVLDAMTTTTSQIGFGSHGGRAGTVIVNPMLGLDGATGQPRWAGGSSGTVLDAGAGAQPPRVLTGFDDATVCRMALPTTPEGAYQPARGSFVVPRPTRDDPRWRRPMPWADEVPGNILTLSYPAFGGIAVVNVLLPLGILRLATRRRFWSVRLLLALPAAVAIPLSVFLMSPSLTVIPMTLLWIPVVIYAALAGRILFRRRWARLADLVGMTALASAALGIGWLWSDRRVMPALEHYDWSGGWLRLAVLGAYLVGMFVSIAWVIRGLVRCARRLGRRILAGSVGSA